MIKQSKLNIMKKSDANILRQKSYKYKFNKTKEYWTEETIIKELKLIIDEIEHFPKEKELRQMNRNDLRNAIQMNNGLNYYRENLGYKLLKKSKYYWTEEIIIKELKSIIDKLCHFPTYNELQQMNRNDLFGAIGRNGGINYFREKMGYKLLKKSNDYWTEETIIKELKLIIDEIEHFPKEKELRQMNKSDLNNTIIKNGGLNYFREKMGYDYVRKPKGYWTKEIIIKELKLIIKEISYFPTQKELRQMNRKDLETAIGINGGINYFREKMGYNYIQKPKDYWTEEIIIKELKLIIKEISCFPNGNKLQQINRYDLAVAIGKNGGYNYFKEKCGFTVSMQEKYRSKLMSYVNIRGNKSEQIVKDIINDWSINNNKSCPDFNVKLAPRNVIEFVCDFNKRIGIDVTNTKASKDSAYTTIQRKWKKKDYCLHLDELWIVIFSDILKSKHYSELNEISPDNVKVFSIYDFITELDYSIEYWNKDKINRLNDFITELDYSIEYWNKDKINRLNDCSFHTKDELIDMSRPVIGWL